MEEIVSSNNNNNPRQITERKTRPQEQLNCPRCNSTNTKFCYYNNYSLTQPRYFCKTCRRYWTEGGSLRNVPVGGGSRKNKRSLSSTPPTSSSSSSVTSKQLIPDLNPPNLSQFQNPNKPQDLNLAFVANHSDQISPFVEIPKSSGVGESNTNQDSTFTASTSPISALDLLRTGISSRGLNSFIPTPMPDSNTLFSSGFLSQEMKPGNLNFSLDGIGTMSGVQESGGGNSGRLFFPFGEMKTMPNSTEIDQNRGQGGSAAPTGFWNGMLGGGSW